MFPILFRIGDFEVSTFGLMAALGFIAAYLVLRAEIKRKGLVDKLAPDLLLAGLIGGLVGARLNFVLEWWDVFVADPAGVLFARAGFTWYGGFVGGALGYIIVVKARRLRLGLYADAVAPALAFGYIFGRVGCQLSGDGDYGVASNLPWAMSYPRGIVPTWERVHPTPVYEMLLFGAIFAVLWRLRKLDQPPWWLFGVYLALAGIERFGIEFLRANPRVFLGLTEAQLVSVGAVIVGVALVAAVEKRRANA